MEETAQEVLKRLDLLAQKFGTTVDNLWPLLLMYEQVMAVCLSLLGAALVATPLIFTKRIWKWSEDNVDSYDRSPLQFILFFSSLACLSIGAGLLITNVPYVFVPEIAAIKEVMSLFKRG